MLHITKSLELMQCLETEHMSLTVTGFGSCRRGSKVAPTRILNLTALGL